jgi:hypothetical protein
LSRHAVPRVIRRSNYVGGFDLLDETQGNRLVDGRHANSMGFYFYARGF